MEDTQSKPADVRIPIDSVGVKNLKLPLVISSRQGDSQHSVAVIELGVNLSKNFKGTHMSRFVEVMENWTEHLSYSSIKVLLEEMRVKLEAAQAQAIFRFPYFMATYSPATHRKGKAGYDCCITATLEENKMHFFLEVVVPVMTVCPCSKAISKEGAHSQRADIQIHVKLNNFTWLEEFIEIAETAGSCRTYPLLKREDEKYVTETAFENPQFVEDVVRNVASQLQKHPHVAWFKVEVESYESIHAHNAFARIERAVSRR